MDVLETARLILRRFTWEDFAFLKALHEDPHVARFIGHGRPRSEEESRGWLRTTLESYERSGTGHLLLVRKEDGAAVGRCGLVEIDVEVDRKSGRYGTVHWGRTEAASPTGVEARLELGYTLAKQYWQKGYAIESALAMRDHAFRERAVEELVSMIHPDNHRSQRIAEGLGMKRLADVISFDRPAVMFEIGRSEWAERDLAARGVAMRRRT